MSISVNQKELIKALQPPKMKRGQIPKITEIRGSFSGDLIITAPAHETRLQGKGSFPYYVTANACILHEIVKKLPKSENVDLETLENQILFRIGSFVMKFNAIEIRSL